MKKLDNSKKNPKSNATGRPANEATNVEIATVAYSIWEQEGRPEGRALEHWRAAEAQVRQIRAPS